MTFSLQTFKAEQAEFSDTREHTGTRMWLYCSLPWARQELKLQKTQMLFIHINYTSINLTWKSSRAPMSRLVDAPRERDRGRGGREARHQRGAAGQPDWAESSRCPAVCQPRCPGRIWESPRLARAGVCVRSTRGKGGHQKKKIKKASELFLFILYASPGFNSPSASSSSSQRHTRVYRPRKPGGTRNLPQK